MDDLKLRILGPLELSCGDVVVPVSAGRQRDVIACLALYANRLLLTERLIWLLWGDDPPPTARNTVHTLVRRVRRLLADRAGQVVQTRPGGYLLCLPAERLDIHQFEQLLRTGRQAVAAGDAEAAVAALSAGLRLWRGTPLADVSAPELLRVERPRLSELRLQAVEELVEARLARGEHADVVGELRATTASHPLRERPYGQLMVALYRCGRQSEALATYRTLRQLLADQLGVEPAPSLQRLHQAVLRADPALDPARASSAVVVQLERTPLTPAQLPVEVAGFVGRRELLATLHRLREGRDRPAIVALVGTAGVGKTALGLRWAHQLREQFPDGQLYLDLHGFSGAPPVRPIDALGIFLRALGVAPEQVPSSEAEAALTYRSQLADRRVLVVLDNARDAEQVRPLLPGGRACLTLVTSRDRLDSLVVREGATRLLLEPLPAGESRELLTQALGRDRVADEPAAASALADLCAHLPLALRIAAANLRGGTLSGYVARLREHRWDGLALVSDGPLAVRKTFDLSYARLSAPAQRMFQRLGCLPAADASLAVLAVLGGLSTYDTERLLDELTNAHLVAELAPDRFGCHDLLREYAGQLAAELDPAERTGATRAVLGWYLAAAETAADLLNPQRLRPLDPPPQWAAGPGPGWQQPAEALAWLDAQRHNLVAVAQRMAAEPGSAAWRFSAALCTCLPPRGHLAELQAACEAGLVAAQADGRATALAAAQLGMGTAMWTRRRRSALEHYRAAVEVATAAGWQEAVAAAQANLANALQQNGQVDEAVIHYAHALAGYERLGRPYGQAVILLNLGSAGYERGDLEPAAAHLRQALELFRQTGSRAAQAVALLNLGMVLAERGRLAEAQPLLTESLTINQELGARIGEAGAMRALAEVYRDLGRLEPARELATEALELARQTGSRQHLAAAAHALATIHQRCGELEPALQRHREALALVAPEGPGHVAVQVQLGLSEVYHMLGRPQLATAHASQALTMARAGGHQRLATLAERALASAGASAVIPRSGTATLNHDN